MRTYIQICDMEENLFHRALDKIGFRWLFRACFLYSQRKYTLGPVLEPCWPYGSNGTLNICIMCTYLWLDLTVKSSVWYSHIFLHVFHMRSNCWRLVNLLATCYINTLHNSKKNFLHKLSISVVPSQCYTYLKITGVLKLRFSALTLMLLKTYKIRLLSLNNQ